MPTIFLDIDIPEVATDSFRRGHVCFQLRDSAFSPSNPVKHMITLVNYILEKNILVTNITLRTACAVLLLQTDGGADHNPQHVAVQAAALALVLLLDLDMAVLIRTVAGHSWAN